MQIIPIDKESEMYRMSVMLSRALQGMSRFGSPLVRVLLTGRMHGVMSRQLLLVAFTGRKSGRSYATPVSYVRQGDELLIPGGGGWWKNLQTGAVTVRLRGSWLRATPEVIAEPQAISDVLGRMMAANPALSIFTGIRRGSDGRPDPESLERERSRGFVVVRLLLEDNAGATNAGRPAAA